MWLGEWFAGQALAIISALQPISMARPACAAACSRSISAT